MNNDYKARIDKVITYIEHNYEQKLTLDQLADVSGFSKYHFTRIFTAVEGVTPIAFVNKRRLQRAVSLLAGTNDTILDICSQCGFESVSVFHSLFKKHYRLTPSEVRSNMKHNSNISLQYSNIQEELSLVAPYNRSRNNQLLQRAWDKMISLQQLPSYEVAYVRRVGSYVDTYLAWEQLGSWAKEHGLTPKVNYFIGISLDDGNFVDELACRYDACVVLPTGFDKQQHPSHIQFKTLPGGLYARYCYYGSVDLFVIAYQNMFGLWLPNSEYEADDRPCLEFSLNDPAQDREGNCKIDLYVPVKEKVIAATRKE